MINIAKQRYGFCFGIIFGLASLLLIRLYYLQVMEQSVYRLLAEDNIASYQIANLAKDQQQAQRLLLMRQAAILAGENIAISDFLPASLMASSTDELLSLNFRSLKNNPLEKFEDSLDLLTIKQQEIDALLSQQAKGATPLADLSNE